MRNNSGFTLVEVIVVVVIIGILAAVTIPNFLAYLPNARLKSASRDLYSHLQLARVGAIKGHKQWAVVFNFGTKSYQVLSDYGGSNKLEAAVDLSSYGSGVTFGQGSAAATIDASGFDDFVTYASNVAILAPRGTATVGYVYLTNSSNQSCYGVGTGISGVVQLRRWSGGGWAAD